MTPSLPLAAGLASAVALFATWGVVWALRILAPRWGLIDVPNQRSSHRTPVPRAGGLAFVVVAPIVALVAGWWLSIPIPGGAAALLLGSAIVAATGFVDDSQSLRVRTKLGAYVLAAIVLVAGAGYLDRLEWPDGLSIALGWMGIPVTLLWIVGLTNAYNFMDGIDGIASVQAIIAAGAIALLAVWNTAPDLALYPAALAGGAAGFLLHNWPPARIFMGDVGSAFLGYSFAGLSVLSTGVEWRSALPTLWLILLAPFLFDAFITLVMRIVRGERWYEPHRQHLYQRLVRQGWSHRTVTLLYLGADLFLATLVIAFSRGSLSSGGLAILSFIPLMGLVVIVRLAETRKSGLENSPGSRLS